MKILKIFSFDGFNMQPYKVIHMNNQNKKSIHRHNKNKKKLKCVNVCETTSAYACVGTHRLNAYICVCIAEILNHGFKAPFFKYNIFYRDICLKLFVSCNE